MSELRHDLAELVADLRALIHAHQGAGFTAEPTGLECPSASQRDASSPPDDAAPAPPSSPPTLAAIRAELGDCQRCGLCQGRTHIVFGIGAEPARLMVIGEGPGAQEDASGEPFVGPAGAMLDRMLENVLGLRREQVYIANVVKCRPPDNRNPSPAEIASCLPFLRQQIRAVQPEVILVLGSVAFRALAGTATGITRARGQWCEVEGVSVMPTYHPAYLLRKPEFKRDTLRDLQAVAARLNQG